MKFCINITSGPLTGTLEDDNLRGEGRWERLVARGLLSAGKQTGTPLPKWAGDDRNWVGHITDFSDAAYVTIYGGLESLPRNAKAYLFQFFSGPNAPIEAEIRQVIDWAGRQNVFLTHSYPSAGTFDKLTDLHDRVVHLPMPVPDVTSGDPTTNTVLFYPSRGVGQEGVEVLRFVRKALDKDPRLTFEALGSTYDSDACRFDWAHPVFHSIFSDVRSRVTLHPPISHAEVQKIYERTRLVVCASGYGGPPLESARVGLPVIALERDCSLYSAAYTPGFSELPRLGKEPLVQILDKLLYDLPYARQVGNACRRYVADHYSYTAFGKALNAIAERMT